MGASFIERNKEVLRGNFINQNLQGNDAHTYTLSYFGPSILLRLMTDLRV
jgi:hypothetical protein